MKYVWVVVTDLGLNGPWIREVWDHDPGYTQVQLEAYGRFSDIKQSIGYNQGTEVVKIQVNARDERRHADWVKT